MPEKSSAQTETSAMRNLAIAAETKAEMQEAIVALAGPRGWAETRESWLNRAARKGGITFRRAKGFFYGEYANPCERDVRKVRAAITTRHEAIDHATTLDRAADALAAIDPDFHRPEIDRLRNTARVLRGIPSRRASG